jgi:hypothetical protein
LTDVPVGAYLQRFVLNVVAASPIERSGAQADEVTRQAMALYFEDPQTHALVTASQGLFWFPIAMSARGRCFTAFSMTV